MQVCRSQGSMNAGLGFDGVGAIGFGLGFALGLPCVISCSGVGFAGAAQLRCENVC